MTTDLGNGRVAAQQAAVPTPSSIRPRRVPAEQAAIGQAAVGQAAVGQAAVGQAAVGQAAVGQAAVGQAARAAGPAIPTAIGGPGRVAVRAALEAALAGVALGGRDRQFLSRLVHWDKRNAASVVSLLRRVRQAGRDEAALTPRQIETVVAALGDAARYRSAGIAAAGCWDCENIPAGRCAEHARDNDRARTYAEMAAALAGSEPEGLPEPRGLWGHRWRRPVAS